MWVGPMVPLAIVHSLLESVLLCNGPSGIDYSSGSLPVSLKGDLTNPFTGVD